MKGLIILFMVMVAAGPARAQSVFFDALGDVPVMPALRELPERAVMFDTPAGTIAQVVALPQTGVEMAEIQLFYRRSLPELGWTAQGEAYLRERQKLTISGQAEQGRLLVVFRLEPR